MLSAARRAVRAGDARGGSDFYRVAADSLEEEGNDLARGARDRARHYAAVARLQARHPNWILQTAEERLPRRIPTRSGYVERTIVGQVGDVGWPTYSGGPIVKVRTCRRYSTAMKECTTDHWVEWIDEDYGQNAGEPERWLVQSIRITPTMYDRVDWDRVSRELDVPLEELLADARSKNPVRRAGVLQDAATVYGLAAFATGPEWSFTRRELLTHYGPGRVPR